MSARSLRPALAVAVLTAVVSFGGAALAPALAQPPAAAESFGKPVAPFSLAAEPVAAPTVGVPVDVRVTLRTSARLEDVEVRVSADAGLSVDVAGAALYARSVSPAEPAEWLVRVVPVTAGEHPLRLFGEALVGGARVPRSEVATIRVGLGTPAAPETGVETLGAKREPGVQGAKRESGVRAEQDSAAGPGEAGGRPEHVIRLPASERP